MNKEHESTKDRLWQGCSTLLDKVLVALINNLWYGKSIAAYLLQFPLLPFSGLFALITGIRRTFYANRFSPKRGPVVPVVIVGGLTVGGTGKTPICIALAQELSARGYHPGILTRGYKAQCETFPCQVPLTGDPEIYGDEPCLMRRTTKVPVVIDPKRSRGADYLAGLGVDVIITDDGLQHYALERDVEICVLDGARMFGNGHLLPAGPLREGKWRLKTVDCTVVSGALAQIGHYPMRYKQTALTPLNPESKEVLAPQTKVCALAGIGHPDRFFKTLEDCGFIVAQKVELVDHSRTSIEHLKHLAQNMPVVMTAKDAIKYQLEAQSANISNVFVLNIAAQLSKQFYNDVVDKIKHSTHRVNQRRQRREASGYVLEPIEDIEITLAKAKDLTAKAPGVTAEAAKAEEQVAPTKKDKKRRMGSLFKLNAAKEEQVAETDDAAHYDAAPVPAEMPITATVSPAAEAAPQSPKQAVIKETSSQAPKTSAPHAEAQSPEPHEAAPAKSQTPKRARRLRAPRKSRQDNNSAVPDHKA